VVEDMVNVFFVPAEDGLRSSRFFSGHSIVKHLLFYKDLTFKI